MKKVFLLSLILVLIAACNPEPASIPVEDQMSTIVYATLAAMPSNTPLPTHTPEPVVATPIPDTPTLPPLITPTTEPTLTATPVLNDIRTGLGAPAWQDTMQSCSTFGLCTPYEDDFSKVSISDGKMVMVAKKGSGYKTWRLASPKPNNVYLETTITTLNCAKNDNYGLVFRAADYSSGNAYYLGLTCDGKVGLDRWEGATNSRIIPFTESTLIHVGPNQTNRLGVILKDKQLVVYINGQAAYSIENLENQISGHIGVYIMGMVTPGFTIEVNELAYWGVE